MKILHIGGHLDKERLQIGTRKYYKLLSGGRSGYRITNILGSTLAVEETLTDQQVLEILIEDYENQSNECIYW